MRVSPGGAANVAAWAATLLLLCAAAVLVIRLQFVGLMLLGGMVLLVGTMADLDQNVPTWGTEVFRARMSKRRSPEQAMQAAEEHRGFTLTLRFFRRCGLVLAGFGLAGFAWQVWGQG